MAGDVVGVCYQPIKLLLERNLLSLPARFGGHAIPIFFQIAEREYEYSKKASQQLTENITSQTAEYSFDNTVHYSTKNDIKRSRNREHEETLTGLQERMNGDQKRANEIAQMKGASNWLNSLPISVQCSTHVKRVSQHSAESRGFSPGAPVSSHREVDRVG